ncbi:N-acetyl-gamma-glutamyl-phosphate reductase [Thalassotalea sediminis]|uniref:N-acetyl-gamma-glutamyl-phosphate reductase n=1 Tax=Thalassotalea sediminis TaxID=1759089 RepID=UPI002572BB0F|nr:N-acetyl-gamma-glutamyl-phosphate reductase [Thalassotalea sediminis]
MNVAVVGASGYVGAELVALLIRHDKINIDHLLVSENSESAGAEFSTLHPRYKGVCDKTLVAFSSQWVLENASSLDAVFFATPHEFSAEWAQQFLNKGVKVIDLSGGFRLKTAADYPHYYGFEHHDLSALSQAVYGLAEWNETLISDSNIIAVPGCYPTASLLALKPIIENDLQLTNSLIVVNGISGVSGAGRKASLATSFNEVSLTPYNILQHRHQPEISQEAKAQVIFNPHLAPYKRGLLTTVTLSLKAGTSAKQVQEAYEQAYKDSAIVRLVDSWPKIDHVAYSPFADIHWQVDEDKHVLVVSCAIDNLLKGAASQSVQCANIILGLPNHYSLVPGVTA